MRGIEWKATMMNAVPYDEHVVLPDLAKIALHLIAELAGFEDYNFEMVGPVHRYRSPAVQDEKSNIDGIRFFFERPHVQTFAADLPTHERIGLFPRQFALCQHKLLNAVDYTRPYYLAQSGLRRLSPSLDGE